MYASKGFGLGSLGFMSLSDLPNQGRNLRLYTYDPPGTPFWNPNGGFVYNTGHYDICGTIVCGDPQGFQTVDAMNAYIQSHGEWGAVMVTRNDLPGLCSAPKPAYCGSQTVTQSQQPSFQPTMSTGPAPIDTGGVSLILRTASPAQPPTVPPIYIPAMPASLDTGDGQQLSSEAQAFQDWLQTHPGGTFADWAASVRRKLATSDNTLLYAVLALGGLFLLTRKRGGGA